MPIAPERRNQHDDATDNESDGGNDEYRKDAAEEAADAEFRADGKLNITRALAVDPVVTLLRRVNLCYRIPGLPVLRERLTAEDML